MDYLRLLHAWQTVRKVASLVRFQVFFWSYMTNLLDGPDEAWSFRDCEATLRTDALNNRPMQQV